MKEKLLKLKEDLLNLRNYNEDQVELKRIKDALDMYLNIIFPEEKEYWHSKVFNVRFAPHLISDGYFGMRIGPDKGEFQQGKVELSNVIDLIIEKMELINSVTYKTDVVDKKCVFIVHGHDLVVKESVARAIEKFNLKAIILNEKANKGKTLVEKLEHYGNVGYAIILLTPCDLGKAYSDKELKPRARQNVIAELGFFIGKLGRENVSVICKGEIEIPSDFAGLGYIPYENNDWQLRLANELCSVGYDIDFNVFKQLD